MGKRVNGNASGAVHSLPASPCFGVVDRIRHNKKTLVVDHRCKWVARLDTIWLCGWDRGMRREMCKRVASGVVIHILYLTPLVGGDEYPGNT